MIVTFCGHSQFTETEKLKKKILAILEKYVGDEKADFYLGGYGSFDGFAYTCGKIYKAHHPNTSLIFVTPYMTLEYQKTIWHTHKSNMMLFFIPKSKISRCVLQFPTEIDTW